MTTNTTTTKPSGRDRTELPSPATFPTVNTPTVRQRRRPAMLGLGAALVAVAGLGGGWLFSTAGHTVSAVVAAHPLRPGHLITDQDLSVKTVGELNGVSYVTGTSKSSLIGRTVSTGVAAGSLINPAVVVSTLTPGAGSAVVGIPVKAGQYPAQGVQAGNRVRIVVTATPANAGAAAIKVGTVWSGTVLTVGDPSGDANNTRTIDVVVPADAAVQLAAATGLSGLTLVLDPTPAR